MITLNKFSKLRRITKYFHVAEVLEAQRNVLAGGGVPDLSDLETLTQYLSACGETEFIDELKNILNEPELRKKFEMIHFLFHTIRERFGYPEPESRFIATARDRKSPARERSELVVILENIRSAFNTGSIIRAAECFGIKKMILAGITPGTDNPKVRKTSKGAEAGVEIVMADSLERTAAELKKDNYIIAGAETGEGSICLPDFRMGRRTSFIFGNEEIGITSDTLKLCDFVVSIKMNGMKNSMNVAGAASVFMYEYSRNYPLPERVSG